MSENATSYWFVGASFSGGEADQTTRFLKEGIWENGYGDKNIELVKSIKAGDKIAIKSVYTRKYDLPFNNRGKVVSVMAIKAIGVVTKNLGDGRQINVEWEQRFEPPKQWFFYTYQKMIWRVMPGEWAKDDLIDFAFNGKDQDIDRFRNAPHWRERFGDIDLEKERFKWTQFYEEIANKLLGYRYKRDELVKEIHAISSRVDGLTYLNDQFNDGTVGPLNDICPFTLIGTFNRGITDANRKVIAKELAAFLKVEEPIPETFEGIPILNNQRSWFFGFEKDRQPDDIDALWNMFEVAIRFADTDVADARVEFCNGYDDVAKRYGVGWNLTMGLYWIRPWQFPTLEGQSQTYITKKLGIKIGMNGPKGRCNAQDYLEILDTLDARFQEEAFTVHSFPELSLASWLYKAPSEITDLIESDVLGSEKEDEAEAIIATVPIPIYSIVDIVNEGCFLGYDKLSQIVERLKNKKNLILQGPPGTGKTWLAKKLAYALMGHKSDSNLRAVQFHPNLSYEDFVRGWRPAGDGKLTMQDGPFLEMISKAAKDPLTKYVVVIEEINRGNPAQIFGEMLTLLEADKRTPSEALELSYRRQIDERVHIPDNLYVIGTMNIADRSLALVDFALRRRFAFINLEPVFGEAWRSWVNKKSGIDLQILEDIESRLIALNEDIASDINLGAQFKVGHSYVTPAFNTVVNDANEWFKQVVETEIAPLLDEYWFDDVKKSHDAQQKLLKGL